MNNTPLFVAALLSCGCVGTDVGNPETRTELEFGVPTPVQTHAQALTSEGYEVEALTVVVASVSGSPDCQGPPKSFADATTVDLLTGSKVILTASEPTICRLTVDFEQPDGDWLEMTLLSPDGRTLSITGTKKDGLRYRGDIPLGQGPLLSSHPILPWILEEKVALDVLPDGALISDTQNVPLFRSFLKAFIPNARLYLDENGNSTVDDSEDAVAEFEP